MTEADKKELEQLRNRLRPELMEKLNTFKRTAEDAHWEADQGVGTAPERTSERALQAELELLRFLWPLHGFVV